MAAASGVTDRASRLWRRFDGPGRLVGIDLARGLAVVGMLAAHLLTIDGFVVDDPATWLDVVNGRSSILFATLAGVSMALVTGGTRPVTGADRSRASARLALRGALLWVIGILLVMTGVPVYVILPAYALLFALALPFLGWSARRLLLVALALGLVMPWVQPVLDAAPIWSGPGGEEIAALVGWAYPFPVWIVFLLAGLGIGRLDLRAAPVQVGVLGAGAVLGIVGYAAAAATASVDDAYLAEVLTAREHSSGLWEVVGSGGFALAVIGLCLLLCRTPVRWAVVPVRAVGSMPLTAYVLQLVVWAVVAAVLLHDTSDLAGIRQIDLFAPLTVLLLLGCTVWALAVGRGPLEAGIDAVVRRVVDGGARRDGAPR